MGWGWKCLRAPLLSNSCDSLEPVQDAGRPGRCVNIEPSGRAREGRLSVETELATRVEARTIDRSASDHGASFVAVCARDSCQQSRSADAALLWHSGWLRCGHQQRNCTDPILSLSWLRTQTHQPALAAAALLPGLICSPTPIPTPIRLEHPAHPLAAPQRPVADPVSSTEPPQPATATMSASAAGSSAAASAGSKRSFPRAAADYERCVQPRHFHAGPNPVAAAASAGDDAAAAESTGPPSAAVLYRHALEAIFGFLNQRELVKVLQVSKDWLAAVKSMASLGLTVRRPSVLLRVIAESTVGRHVAQLGADEIHISITLGLLSVVARLMPQLRGLSCDLKLTPAQALLTFPPGLRELHLRITDGPTAADINAALRVVSRLPLLEGFILHLNDFDEQISFAPLSSLPLLRHLSILSPPHRPEFSDAQVAELRALTLLQRLDVRPMSTPLLRRLLKQPHDLQWRRMILPDDLSDAVVALLPQLPTLTGFGAVFGNATSAMSCSNFDFLRQLPQLTHVGFRISEPSTAARIDSLMAALPCCSQIEFLTISTDISAAHLSELLPRLPQLRTFCLGNSRAETLSFLAQPPMTRQLAVLRLISCSRLPLTELRHVHALRGLEDLLLLASFDEPMDSLCQSLHTPPSALMPQLKKFFFKRP